MTAPREAYPGPASFQDSDEDRALFHGREDEKRALLHLVLAENLVLLFARSGMGKTSLLNAGLMEPLREVNYFPVVARVIHDEKNGPVASIIARFREEAQRRNVQVHSSNSANTLWNFFAETEFLSGRQSLVPVLILDQFEELFTRVMGEGRDGRNRGEQFVRQLADLVQRRMPEEHRASLTRRLGALEPGDPERKRLDASLYQGEGVEAKVIISIREDFLPEIEAIKAQLPDVFRASFRLEPLNLAQARDAIVNPSQQDEILGEATFTFAEGVVDEMIAFLARQRTKGQWRVGDQVDPHLLQILCQHANRCALTHPDHVVQSGDLGGQSGMQRIVRDRYLYIVRQVPRFRRGWSARRWKPSWDNWFFFHGPRRAVRRLCEEKLITSGGHRNSREVAEVTGQFGVPQSDLNLLVDQKLLRREERLGTDFYELRHDTWIETCQAAQRRRRIAFFRNVAFAICVLGIVAISGDKIKTQAEALWWRHRLSDESLSARERVDLVVRLAKVGESRLKGIRLADADFRNRDLTFTDFSEARLTRANFALADLILTKFKGAEIDAAIFENARIYNADFGGASLRFSSFSLARTEDTNFQSANLEGANFAGALMNGADLSGADLRNTTWSDARLREADLSNAKAVDANFRRTDLAGADLTNIDLTGANLEYASAKDVRGINSAKLDQTNWWLLKGLTDETINDFQARWPITNYGKSEAALRHLQRKLDAVKGASSDSGRVVALNNVAWFRAVSGMDLETAREEVNQSIQLSSYPGNLDTLGYINLILKDYNAAERSFAAAIIPESDVFIDVKPAVIYHLALALDYQGKDGEARKRYKEAFTLGYEPSYERVLTPALITLTDVEMKEIAEQRRAAAARER